MTHIRGPNKRKHSSKLEKDGEHWTGMDSRLSAIIITPSCVKCHLQILTGILYQSTIQTSAINKILHESMEAFHFHWSSTRNWTLNMCPAEQHECMNPAGKLMMGDSVLENFDSFMFFFHSVVQTNMKLRFVSWLSHSTTIKQHIHRFSWGKHHFIIK